MEAQRQPERVATFADRLPQARLAGTTTIGDARLVDLTICRDDGSTARAAAAVNGWQGGSAGFRGWPQPCRSVVQHVGGVNGSGLLGGMDQAFDTPNDGLARG